MPSTAKAVVLTVTGTQPDAATFLTAFPSGTTTPNASNVNLPAGATVSNQVIVPLTAGAVSLVSALAPVDVIVELHGYYAP